VEVAVPPEWAAPDALPADVDELYRPLKALALDPEKKQMMNELVGAKLTHFMEDLAVLREHAQAEFTRVEAAVATAEALAYSIPPPDIIPDDDPVYLLTRDRLRRAEAHNLLNNNSWNSDGERIKRAMAVQQKELRALAHAQEMQVSWDKAHTRYAQHRAGVLEDQAAAEQETKDQQVIVVLNFLDFL
jgi:hypothetical protein